MATNCNCLHAEDTRLACVCDDDTRGGTLRELAEMAAYRDVDAAVAAYLHLSGGAR